MRKPACSPATTLGKTDDPKCDLVPLQHDSDSSISLLSLTMYQTQQKKTHRNLLVRVQACGKKHI